MDLGRPGMLNPSHLGLPPRSFTFSGMVDPMKGVSPSGYRGGMLGAPHDYQSDFMLGDISRAPGAGTYAGGGGAAHGITPGGPVAGGGEAAGAGAGVGHGGGMNPEGAAQGAGRGASAPNTASAQGAPDPPDQAFQTAQRIVGLGKVAIRGGDQATTSAPVTSPQTGDIMGGEGEPSTSTGATSARASSPAPGAPTINEPTGTTPTAGDIAAGGGVPNEFGVAADANAVMPGGSGGPGPSALSAEMATTGSQPVGDITTPGGAVSAPTSALGAAGKVAGAAGAGLSAASAVKSMVEAIQSGDGVKIASASAQMASAGISSIQEAEQMGLISKDTMASIAPSLEAAAPYLAMGGIVLGIAEHDPGAVTSGIGGTAVAAGVASGVIGGVGALATGGLAALPAAAIMAGQNRAQAIDARRGRATRASMADFQAAPETKNLPKEMAALNAGDASQLAAIGHSAGLALRVHSAGNAMETGGPNMSAFFSAVSARIPPQYLGQFYDEVAKTNGWDSRASASDSYQFVTEILGAQKMPMPTGYKARMSGDLQRMSRSPAIGVGGGGGGGGGTGGGM